MHESAVMRNILGIVLSRQTDLGYTRVVDITIQAGELRNLEEDWMQRYFDWFSKDTPASGAKVHLETVPLEMYCGTCGTSFRPSPKDPDKPVCPRCGGHDCALVHGLEMVVKNMIVV